MNNNLLQDTPEAYYWMGFLASDGWLILKGNDIPGIALQLAIKDLEQVERLRNFVEGGTVRCYPVSSNSPSTCRISCYDKYIVPILSVKFGIHPHKTSDPGPFCLDWMSDTLFLSYLIGFIDGDGSISPTCKNGNRPSVRIKLHYSWLPNLNYLDTRLASITGKTSYGARLNGSGHAVVNWGNWDTVLFLRKFVDLQNLPVLSRKWDRISPKESLKQAAWGTVTPVVSDLLTQGLSPKEIAEKTGLNLRSVMSTSFRVIKNRRITNV